MSDSPSVRDQSRNERAKAESDLDEAMAIATEVLERRSGGHHDELDGTGDNDMLGAVEALEDACKAWRVAHR